jgi:hypothetical protein
LGAGAIFEDERRVGNEWNGVVGGRQDDSEGRRRGRVYSALLSFHERAVSAAAAAVFSGFCRFAFEFYVFSFFFWFIFLGSILMTFMTTGWMGGRVDVVMQG